MSFEQSFERGEVLSISHFLRQVVPEDCSFFLQHHPTLITAAIVELATNHSDGDRGTTFAHIWGSWDIKTFFHGDGEVKVKFLSSHYNYSVFIVRGTIFQVLLFQWNVWSLNQNTLKNWCKVNLSLAKQPINTNISIESGTLRSLSGVWFWNFRNRWRWNNCVWAGTNTGSKNETLSTSWGHYLRKSAYASKVHQNNVNVVGTMILTAVAN